MEKSKELKPIKSKLDYILCLLRNGVGSVYRLVTLTDTNDLVMTEDGVEVSSINLEGKIVYKSIPLGASYSIIASDKGKVLLVESASDITISTNLTLLSTGFYCTVRKNNTGNILFNLTGAGSIQGTGGVRLNTENASAFLDIQPPGDILHIEGELEPF